MPVSTSDAARELGRIKSDAKAAAARQNGQRGGRPMKALEDVPCTCEGGSSLQHKSTCPRGRLIRQRRAHGKDEQAGE